MATDNPLGSSAFRAGRWNAAGRIFLGLGILILGGLALVTPVLIGETAPFVLGLSLIAAGTMQLLAAFAIRVGPGQRAAFFNGGISLLAGALLAAETQFIFTGLTLLLGLSWIVGGVVRITTAIRGRDQPDWYWAVADGGINVLLGVSIAAQWPLSGVWSIGAFVGIRLLSMGWSMVVGHQEAPTRTATEAGSVHPDARLGLPPHPEVAKLRAAVQADESARKQINRYWRAMFVLTFFAIHVGRMDAEWNLVGLLSPALAVVGDLCYSLALAYIVMIPLATVGRTLTRPLERRAWRYYLGRLDQGGAPGLLFRPVYWWLTSRLRFALWSEGARSSPTAGIGRGLQVGLPVTAILIATNPIWGFSWYFNTENWVTFMWEHWAAQRTDTWRAEMVRAVRDDYRDSEIQEADLFRVTPEGVASGDFSFLVIGDTGEGDPSQHILRDQYQRLCERPDLKFVVLSSDVIYPQGAMKDYETKFYLPFKGVNKPIYAIPGNHDWYDALEAFTANFSEPRAARAALRARRLADHQLTTTTEARIESMLEEAARLRAFYGVQAGRQRAPYFEIQLEDFAVIAVDTGILRELDLDQFRWLAEALKRAGGKAKLVILGHPLYAAGRYQGATEEKFAAIHRLLREHEVEVAMGGDTHCFEFFREKYETDDGERTMLHFVNGGGGAYLSIGTPLSWPAQPPVPDCGHYPRADAVIAKLDSQTPPWKQPIWMWVKQFDAWPSSPEGMAAAFDYNAAPFFQSFMEVRVERSAGVVRLFLHGANGRLRWRDLQVYGQVVPEGQDSDALVEFQVRLPAAAARIR